MVVARTFARPPAEAVPPAPPARPVSPAPPSPPWARLGTRGVLLRAPVERGPPPKGPPPARPDPPGAPAPPLLPALPAPPRASFPTNVQSDSWRGVRPAVAPPPSATP